MSWSSSFYVLEIYIRASLPKPAADLCKSHDAVVLVRTRPKLPLTVSSSISADSFAYLTLIYARSSRICVFLMGQFAATAYPAFIPSVVLTLLSLFTRPKKSQITGFQR